MKKSLKVIILFILLLSFLKKNFAQDSLFIDRQISNDINNLPSENVDLSKLPMQFSNQFYQINLRRNGTAVAKGNFKLQAQIANNIAVYNFQNNNLKAAENYFQQAMQNYNSSNNPKMLALMTARLAYVYDMDMDFDKALDLYKQSLKNLEQLKL